MGFSKKIFMGLVVALLVSSGILIALQFQKEGFFSFRGPSCADSDAEKKERGIYTKSTILSYDEDGNKFVQTDRCQSVALLQESSCAENPAAFPRALASSFLTQCVYGCADGACREPEAESVRSVSVSAPATVEWNEGGIMFALTDISLTDLSVTSGGTGRSRVLVFTVKVTNSHSSQMCVPM